MTFNLQDDKYRIVVLGVLLTLTPLINSLIARSVYTIAGCAEGCVVGGYSFAQLLRDIEVSYLPIYGIFLVPLGITTVVVGVTKKATNINSQQLTIAPNKPFQLGILLKGTLIIIIPIVLFMCSAVFLGGDNSLTNLFIFISYLAFPFGIFVVLQAKS